MDIKNSLAEKLFQTLTSSSGSFSIADDFSTLNKTQCLDKIKQNMHWLNQLNVNSVMMIGSPSMDSFCMCYALVLSNKTYMPVHRSTSSELLKRYLQAHPIDLLLVQTQLVSQIDGVLNHQLMKDKQDEFCCYFPENPQPSCMMPGIILFTSGTTGFPKAVHHRFETVSQYMRWCHQEFALTQEDVVLFSTELAFAASLRPLFIPTLAQAKLRFINHDSANKIHWITNTLIQNKITVLNLTPTLFKILLHTLESIDYLKCLKSIRLILLSGEPIETGVINHWFWLNPNTVIYNLYGTTECLVPFYKKITGPIPEKDRLHLGEIRPGCDYQLVMDSGKGYELCISGGLSTAYLDEQLNQNRNLILNHKAYVKTQDFVNLRENKLFFVSRTQRILKRYGQLINLDQIEYVLKTCHSGLNCIALADEANHNKIYLIMLGVTHDDALIRQIQQSLKTHLPNYMHPHACICIPEVPLTASGKVDYLFILKKYIHSHTEQLVDYFKPFFNGKPLHLNAKIADLGLESIDYIEMAELIFKKTGKWLDVSNIHEGTRIADIASCLCSMPLEKTHFKNMVQIHPIYQAYYADELNYQYDDQYITCLMPTYCLKEGIDVKKLELAIAQTLRSHFMLNCKIKRIQETYFFVKTTLQPSFILKTSLFSRNKLTKLITSIHAERLVHVYIQKKKNRYHLIISFHHIALDGWSMALFREEIFRRYEGIHEINCLKKSEEIDCLNQVNAVFWTESNKLEEFKSRLSGINPEEYNHFTCLFGGILKKQDSCFTLEKTNIDRWAEENGVQEFSYSVLFILILNRMISQMTEVKKLMFYVSLSNRNLPVPHIKKLLANLATGLPVFFDSTNLGLKAFAKQIQETLTLYFKNMSFAALQEIWEQEIIDKNILSPSNSRYRILFAYINKLVDKECIQSKYIDWERSTNQLYPGNSKIYKNRGFIFFRIYNLGSHFVVTMNSQMKNNGHQFMMNGLKGLGRQ